MILDCKRLTENIWICDQTCESPVGENSIWCYFVDNENFVEAYDLNTDPFQLSNIAANKHQISPGKVDPYKQQIELIKSRSMQNSWIESLLDKVLLMRN